MGSECLTNREFDNCNIDLAKGSLKPFSYCQKDLYSKPRLYCNSSAAMDISIFNREKSNVFFKIAGTYYPEEIL